MGARSTVEFVTGPAGSGKSYRQCAYRLVKEFLPEGQGVHYSNFPIRLEPWTDGNGKDWPGLVAICERKGMQPDEVRQRVKVFSEEQLKSWKNEATGPRDPVAGPWDVLNDMDLSGAHIAIDECHHYCGKASPLWVRKRWQAWLGELRHQGATVEFLSQHPEKVASEVKNEAEVRYELVPSEQRRDPFFKIKLYDWYQLQAKLTGTWAPSIWRCEYRCVMGKWRLQETSPFWLDADLFGVYDSFSAPIGGGKSGTTGLLHWQRLSWPRLVLWFLGNNFFSFVPRLAVVVALLLAFIYREPLLAAYFNRGPSVLFGQPEAKKEAGPVVTEVKETAAAIQSAPISSEQKALALSKQNEQLAEEVDRLEKANAQASLEAKQMADQLRAAFAVSALTHDQVVFRSGFAYGIGEEIDLGPYKGLKLMKVDYGRRIAILSDGSSLRMGYGLQDKQQADTNAPQLPKPLPATRGDGNDATRSAAGGKAPVSLNGGNAPSGVLPMGQQPIRR